MEGNFPNKREFTKGVVWLRLGHRVQKKAPPHSPSCGETGQTPAAPRVGLNALWSFGSDLTWQQRELGLDTRKNFLSFLASAFLVKVMNSTSLQILARLGGEEDGQVQSGRPQRVGTCGRLFSPGWILPSLGMNLLFRAF